MPLANSDALPCCVVCGSTATECFSRPTDYISKESFIVVRCLGCGLVYVHPQPAAANLVRYYPAAHQQAEPAHYERMDARSRVAYIERLMGGRVGYALDVGCGKGLLLSELSQRGWNVAGTELSEVSGSYARSQGLEVQICAVEDVGFSEDTFDLITLFHVLEHLPSPGAVLDNLRALLKEDGTLVVEVPNIGSWYARFFKDDWFHFDVPRHLFHFDPHTLSGLLSNHGFVVTERHTYNVQYDAFGGVQSLLNSILSNPNLLNNFNTKQVVFRDLWQGGRGWPRVVELIVSELVLAVGFPTFAAAALLSSLWTDGGTLRFVAKRG